MNDTFLLLILSSNDWIVRFLYPTAENVKNYQEYCYQQKDVKNGGSRHQIENLQRIKVIVLASVTELTRERARAPDVLDWISATPIFFYIFLLITIGMTAEI
ncbi:hypothetical protein ABEB36_006194 [Hypothenemus hampei]|uniref:Uncharacterized protein n=1 Tax=Hypothenemus hampei TaxID=57062 RepID=A0ABD1EPP5_HYPHA